MEDIQEEKKEKKEKKIKTFADLQKDLVKDFGKETILTGDNISDIPVICSSGSITLDVAIGIGGLPRGRIMEFFGPPSGGKTLFTLLAMIECQRLGGTVVFIDLENSFDPAWFRKLGGSTDSTNFILIRPKNGAEAYEIIDTMVASDQVDLIGVDSVSTMLTAEEQEGDYGSHHMAVLARLMSDSLKKLNGTMMSHSRASIIFVNQIRSGMDKYHPEVTTGGKALEFYSSVRLRIIRVGGKDGILGEETNPTGFRTRIRVDKNKVGPPKRVIETSIYVNHPDKIGVDKDEELIDVALSINLIKRLKKNEEGVLVEDDKGSYYEINGEQIYGWPKFTKYLEEHPQLLENLKPAIYEFMKMRVKPEPEPDSFQAEVQKEEKKQRKQRKIKEESEEV